MAKDEETTPPALTQLKSNYSYVNKLILPLAYYLGIADEVLGGGSMLKRPREDLGESSKTVTAVSGNDYIRLTHIDLIKKISPLINQLELYLIKIFSAQTLDVVMCKCF